MIETAANDSRRLTLTHSRGPCDVVVGPGILRGAGGEAGDVVSQVVEWCRDRVVFLITSEIPDRYCGAAARELLQSAARVETIMVPDGEPAKTVDCASSVWGRMVDCGGKRDSLVVTLGGGTVSDLGGFVAGCFLRGVEFVQIPTTLLSQVDASVGGKTGIDLPGGKNMVGVFHYPRYVLADVEALRTLARQELRAGLFEVVKMAALLDLGLLARVEGSQAELFARDPKVLTPLIVASIRAKIGVVQGDLEESDQRRLLNFGHTLAHALEAEFGYRALNHGDAVAHGMRFALRLARKRGLHTEFVVRMMRLIERLGPPDLGELQRRRGVPLDVDRLMEVIRHDKKAREDGLGWVLPAGPARGVIVTDVDPVEVRAELVSFLEGHKKRGPERPRPEA